MSSTPRPSSHTDTIFFFSSVLSPQDPNTQVIASLTLMSISQQTSAWSSFTTGPGFGWDFYLLSLPDTGIGVCEGSLANYPCTPKFDTSVISSTFCVRRFSFSLMPLMKSGYSTVKVDSFPLLSRAVVSKGSLPTQVLFLSLTEQQKNWQQPELLKSTLQIRVYSLMVRESENLRESNLPTHYLLTLLIFLAAMQPMSFFLGAPSLISSSTSRLSLASTFSRILLVDSLIWAISSWVALIFSTSIWLTFERSSSSLSRRELLLVLLVSSHLVYIFFSLCSLGRDSLAVFSLRDPLEPIFGSFDYCSLTFSYRSLALEILFLSQFCFFYCMDCSYSSLALRFLFQLISSFNCKAC